MAALRPLALFVALCSAVTAAPAPAPAAESLHVVATFSTIGSLVQAVGGSRVTVTNLVPIGASPEDYQSTPADIRTLAAAPVLFENGGGIESWLDRTIRNAGNANLHTIVLSDGITLKDDNPHLWMDPVFAKKYVAKIAAALTAADPAGRDAYARNARTFDAQLDTLRRWIAGRIATIPQKQRTMIVFHNAWQYYNDRFGLRTVGVIELSPGQDPSPRYIADLVRLAKENHVRAVFAEPEYSPKLVQALAQSAGINTVANLYDDSIGTIPSVHDYPSMLRHDTDVIVGALR